MNNFAVIIFIVVLLVILSAFAPKIKLPYPILLLGAGVAIGYIPFLPTLDLDPEIVFLIFLPPLLYEASLKSSWLDFKKEIRPISTLAITLVLFTTVTVGITAHYFIPGFSWPLAFLLGAIVSPPDAVAATSITKGMGLNRRVLTIIEGESLVNDASALIAYRYALLAVTSGSFVFWKAGLGFLLVAAGGVVTGLVVGYVLVFAHRKITDNAIVETILSLLTPFIAYIIAEHFKVSGILAVVTAGFFISWNAREILTFDTRLQTRIVWDNIIFVLNGLVFIFMGMQVPAIVDRFEENHLLQMIGYGLLVSVVTIIIRIVWVFVGAYHQNFLSKKGTNQNDKDAIEPISWKNVFVVAWTGTRGVVSLATALAIPLFISGKTAFPLRDQILFFTFIVIFITLVIQGSSLPLLIRTLRIKPEVKLQKQEDREMQLVLTEKILQFIDHHFPIKLDDKVTDRLRKVYQANHNILSQKTKPGSAGEGRTSSQLNFITGLLSGQLEIIKFQRQQLLKFQKEGTFNEETISTAEMELDIEELRINNMMIKRVEDGEQGKDA